MRPTAAATAPFAAYWAISGHATQAPKAEEPPKADEPRVEDPPRDEGGKFAKKERQADLDTEVRIPKSRFDEQVAKERDRAEAAERRAAELEARLSRLEAEKQGEFPPDKKE